MIKKLVGKTIVIISIIILVVIVLSNLFYHSQIENDISEKVNLKQITVLVMFISTLIAIGILYIGDFLKKIVLNKKVKIALLVISIGIYVAMSILWINISRIEPVADQKVVHDVAVKIVEGNASELKGDVYLELNSHQIGISCFLALIYKVFNSTNYHIIQYLNIICNIISIMGIYCILKKFLNKYKFNEFTYFIINFTFIPVIMLVTFVYGDYIGLALSIIAIYTIMKYTDTSKIRYLLISALLIGVSYIIKSNYLIFAIAFIVYLVLDILKEIKWKKIVLCIVFIILTILPNTILQYTATKKIGLDTKNTIPTLAYISIGMNEGTRECGWYSSDIIGYAWDHPEEAPEYYKEQVKRRVIELVKNPLYSIKFYAKKTVSMWAEVTFGSVWYNLPFQAKTHEEYLYKMEESRTFQSISAGKLNDLLVIYQKALVMLILIGAFIAIWKNRKNLDNNILLFITIFIGGFLFHTIWEAKSRYVLPYLIIIIPVAVIGLQELACQIQNWYVKNIKEK